MEEHMKKKNYLLVWLIPALIIIGLGACRSTKEKEVEWYIPEVVDIHTTKLVMGWDGAYTGIIPSASSMGIDVLIMLNYDDTYMLRYKYVDKPEKIYTSKGSFKWDKSEEMIILPVKNLPPYYKVGQNKLIQLDMNGKYITDDLAEGYILRKIAP
jgi:uncharacterized lipoprotein NlpE involved in copper resistance